MKTTERVSKIDIILNDIILIEKECLLLEAQKQLNNKELLFSTYISLILGFVFNGVLMISTFLCIFGGKIIYILYKNKKHKKILKILKDPLFELKKKNKNNFVLDSQDLQLFYKNIRVQYHMFYLWIRTQTSPLGCWSFLFFFILKIIFKIF